MPGPFPGMDPYLERSGYWQGFHNSLITYLNSALNQVLPRRFLARCEARVSMDLVPPLRPVPDASVFALARRLPETAPQRPGSPTTLSRPIVAPEEILLEERREAYIEILDRAHGNRVVMVIEVLSPENKAGSGRAEYLRKQKAVLQSQAHLLELDLLRGGLHAVAAPEEGARALGTYAYLLSLSDVHRPDTAFVWRIGLRDPLPVIQLPLTPEADPIALDLQAVFDRCYDENRYADLLADTYTQPVEPPLPPDEAAWVLARIDASLTGPEDAP